MRASEIKLDYHGVGPANGELRVCMTAVHKRTGEIVEIDTFNVRSRTSRRRFVERLASKLEGGDSEKLDRLILRVMPEIEAKAVAREREQRPLPSPNGRPHRDTRPGTSQATQLVALADERAELFRDGGGDAFATVEVDGHAETWPVGSRGFRRWLMGQYYSQARATPNAQALRDAIGVIEGRCWYEGATHTVHTRVAEHDGHIYLDLADPEWRAVEVGAGGWRIVDRPPVKFRRARGMQSLPAPLRDGNLDTLRDYINVRDEDEWRLLVACVLAYLRPAGPYPVLLVHGEQGAAKSTAARMARELVDPSDAPLRAEPKEVRDLMIAARNGWVVALDNLSHVQPWLSDALCRLSTGGGFATRELYTDSEEIIFCAQRPVIINGIEELAGRGDLLDRAVILYLPSILEHQRRPERELWQEFHAVRPRILGALLDVVSGAMGHLPNVRLARVPRMADFAQWASAAEPALGWPEGSFLAAYMANRESANSVALEASPVAPCIRALVAKQGSWCGTAGELLEALAQLATEGTRKQRVWPGSARALSGVLRRLVPNLRRVGIDVDFSREAGGGRRRMIMLSNRGGDTVPTVPTVPS